MKCRNQPGLALKTRIQSAIRRLPGFLLAAIALVSLGTGCQTARVKETSWQQTLLQELPVLGHRNWIIIADSAYPAQTSPGVQTIYTEGHQLDVVKAVLAALDGARHVQPIIHVDSELQYVPETLAPGTSAYRSQLKELLKNRRVVELPHEQLIAKLDEAGKTFKVIVLKTDLTIPYTSVFMQLDCGYWGPEPEKQLREAIAKGKQ